VAEVFPYVASAEKGGYHMETRRENFHGMASGGSRIAEEFSAQPEGQREAYGGVETEAFPTTTHQRAVGCLFTEIAVYLRAREEKSRVISSPFAVFLEEDGKRCEPDLAVICDEEKLDEEGCHGAPDWVVEVVSSGSRRADYGRKLGAYIDAGVREYWIVDPEKKVITVFDLEEPDVPVIHPFGDIVKSCIYRDLLIDSSQLDDIRYRKASPRARGQEDLVSSLVSAVKKALLDENCRGEVPGGLVEHVIARELGAAGGQEDAAAEQEYPGAAAETVQRPPEGVSAAEVRAYIEDNFAELAASKNKGQLMKAVMGALKGRADSRVVNEAVAELCR